MAKPTLPQLERHLYAADYEAGLKDYMSAHHQRVAQAIENWWDKHRATMQDIKAERKETREKLNGFLHQLGFSDSEAAR